MLHNIGKENFLSKSEPIDIICQKLPHWLQDNKLIFDTLRLGDSIPFHVLQQYRILENEFFNTHPRPWTEETYRKYHWEIRSVIDKYIDSGYGACYFKDPNIRDILITELKRHDGKKYKLYDFVIMPNHIHFLILPNPGEDYEKIISNFKKQTASKINLLIGRKGNLWQREHFDRIVRSYANLTEIIQYIAANPSGLPPNTYFLSSSNV